MNSSVIIKSFPIDAGWLLLLSSTLSYSMTSFKRFSSSNSVESLHFSTELSSVNRNFRSDSWHFNMKKCVDLIWCEQNAQIFWGKLSFDDIWNGNWNQILCHSFLGVFFLSLSTNYGRHTEMAVIDTSKLKISSSKSKKLTNFSQLDKHIRQMRSKCNGSGNILNIYLF